MTMGLKSLADEKHTNISLVFRISHNIKKLTPIMESYGEAEKAAVEQFGERDSEGKFVVSADGKGVKIADGDGFSKAISSVLDQEVEVTDLKPITWAMLQNAKVPISPNLVLALGPLVEGELVEND